MVVILTCSNSRVAPEQVFDLDTGDAFVVRQPVSSLRGAAARACLRCGQAQRLAGDFFASCAARGRCRRPISSDDGTVTVVRATEADR
jgi:hypothetical protein